LPRRNATALRRGFAYRGERWLLPTFVALVLVPVVLRIRGEACGVCFHGAVRLRK
jgi:hypothetical protein